MDLGELKQHLQEHFTDGLVTIVGSGLSVAEGIPGMRDLATHLQKEVPTRLSSESRPVWDRISAELDKGTDLETTMLTHPPDSELETANSPGSWDGSIPNSTIGGMDSCSILLMRRNSMIGSHNS